MIKKAILVSIILLLIYEVLLQTCVIKTGITQNQRHSNTVIAEKFILNETEGSAILVGSSIGARLNQEELGDKIFNLSLGGLGVFDGMELIRKLNRIPNQLLIEINVLKRGASEPFDSEFKYLEVKKISLKSKSFQSIYQPAGIVGEWFGYSVIGKIFYKLKLKLLSSDTFKKKEQKESKNQFVKVDSLIQEKLRKSIVETVDSLKIRNNILKLRNTIELIKPKKIIFVQIPSGYSVNHSLNNQFTIEELHKMVIKNTQIDFFIPDSLDLYDTTDGVHLEFNSAKLFSKKMKMYLLNSQ